MNDNDIIQQWDRRLGELERLVRHHTQNTEARLAALENRTQSVEEMVGVGVPTEKEIVAAPTPQAAKQMVASIHDPITINMDDEPCCNKRHALARLYRAFGPEPVEAVVDQVRVYFHQKRQQEGAGRGA